VSGLDEPALPDQRVTSALPIDDHGAALYTVGQVASMLGVQPAFLRRLDAEEVVQPARSPGGQRRYSRTEIGQVERVSALASEGLTLAGIRRLLALEAEVAELQRQLAIERARRRPPAAPR
jgi:DNA-binding transcriptional MerR regulator